MRRIFVRLIDVETESFGGERIKMQLRADFFNIFNHPTFGTPNSALQTGVFGFSTNTATSERQIQLGARFMF